MLALLPRRQLSNFEALFAEDAVGHIAEDEVPGGLILEPFENNFWPLGFTLGPNGSLTLTYLT